MNPANEQEERLFGQALEKAAGAERNAFLDHACGTDNALRRRLEDLLQAHENPGTSLEAEPAGVDGVKATIRFSLADDEAVGTRIDRYKLLQKIGEGGMGVVYMAEQEEPVRRRVALKIIKLGMDTKQVVARFEAERQALALMDHPNIARVLDGGATESGRPYFVMELVRGMPITEFCDKNKLSARERLKLFIPICQAVQSAHQKGIIHRDLKPSNVLVTLNHGEPVPMVIDFGIAKTTSQKLTEKTLFTNYGAMIGTPAYMSPEQAEMSSLDVDTRVDVYSLGVLLYELLTGSTPFPEKRLRSLAYGEMQRVIMEEEPERPSTRLGTMDQEQRTTVMRNRAEQGESLCNLLKGDLDWIVMKCLEKDRRRRYGTAHGLARDIERHLNNELVTARPPSNLYRLQKLVHRNKLACAAAAAVAATMALGIIASTWQAVRATQAEQRERSERQLAVSSEKKLARGLYASRMNLASRAWAEGSLHRVTELLDQYRPKPGEEDLRGFEWFYLWRLCHSEQLALRHEDAPMRSVAFSPDGRFIATGGDDATARIWDAQSGQLVLKVAGHECLTNSTATNGFPLVYGPGVNSVSYAPDGSILATGGADETVRLWDTATGAQKAVLPGHSGGVTAVAFGPGGKWLAAATGKLGDAAYRNSFYAWWDDHPLAAEVKIWDIQTRKVIRTFQGYNKSILSMAVSSDGRWIATSDMEERVKLWNVASGMLETSMSGFSMPVMAMAFSPDAQVLAVGGADTNQLGGRIELWDAAGRQLEKKIPTRSVPNALAFSPDGLTIAVAEGPSDYTVRLLNVATGKEMRTIKGHTWLVPCLAYDPGGQRLATAAWDQHVMVWDAAHSQDYDQWPRAAADAGFCAGCFSADGKFLVCGSTNLTVLEAASRKELTTFGGYGASSIRNPIAVSSNVLASGGVDGTIMLREVGSWRTIGTLKDDALLLAFSPDGKLLATADGEEIKLWDVREQRLKRSFAFHTMTYYRNSLEFTPDSRLIMGTTGDHIRFLDVESGREVKTLELAHYCAALSPDGHFMASGAVELRLTDLRTMEVKWRARNADRIVGICFSPDGKTIGTVAWDNRAKLWNADSGEDMFECNVADPVSITFSHDGRWCAVGGRNGETLLHAATLSDVRTVETSVSFAPSK